jgi:small subunit ribosomal protein S4
MARYTGPLSKIARRFGAPIFGPDKAVERKNYPPGQHGLARKRKKLSGFGMQLQEKQKAKYIYGVLERQFAKTFVKATKGDVTGTALLQILETRLDNFVFRLGFAPTRRAARQLVGHRHIVVNGKVVNIPSYSLKAGDIVSVREKSKALEVVVNSLANRTVKADWLEVDKTSMSGKLLSMPERDHITENINEQFIVELYSK